ncbi:MAG: hypothetical protein ACLQU5_35915, partial [Isosphaeraceae bacterium]
MIGSSHLADKDPGEPAEPPRAAHAGHVSGRGSFLPFGTSNLSEDDDASLSHRRPGGPDGRDDLVRARDHRAHGRADHWNLGFSYKSPIWQERWGFNASTLDLAARRIGIQAQVPEIFSWGIAYMGFERALIDVDLRYFDYKNTSLYGTKPIDGGLGW